MLSRIVTHQDFDGIVSAVLCSAALKIDTVSFTGPRHIQEARFATSEEDVVCDLPCPLSCGLWFDHHAGNLEQLAYRQIDVQTIPGKFEAVASCARVVYGYFQDKALFPGYYERLVEEADVIDSFNYQTLEEWRRETPGKIIDATVRVAFEYDYYRFLFDQLKELPIEEVAACSEVQSRYRDYLANEDLMLKEIGKEARFLEEDIGHELIVLDLTHYRHPPQMVKNLAYLKFPDSLGVVFIRCVFEDGRKTNDLHVSMSLSIRGSREGLHQVGEIMRQLNIGDGHAGAAAGTLSCKSKADMLSQKEKLLTKIDKLWRQQRNGCV